jgi:acetyltransferase-like isoleucine patch superfamily enzyme
MELAAGGHQSPVTRVVRTNLGRILSLIPASKQAGLFFLIIDRVGNIPSHALRLRLYRLLGLQVGRGAHIYGGLEIREPMKVTIGDGTVVGHDVILDGRKGIHIGRNVNVSSQAAIWTLQHDPQDPNFGTSGGTVTIGDRAWLSFRCVILPGVTIGAGAVVAAGAVVTADVDPHTIVGGIPARPIGRRDVDLRYELASENHMAFV